MNLLIDCGNTALKWAWATEKELRDSGYCDQKSIFSLVDVWQVYGKPDRVLISNVTGNVVAETLTSLVKSLWSLTPEYPVSSKVCCGISNAYHRPDELGVDRWLALIAASHMSDFPFVVIDCGTAVTVDVVDDDRVFIGGVIMPGLLIAMNSLNQETAINEDAIKKKFNIETFPLSTSEGVVAGVIYGLSSGIEKAISVLCSTFKGESLVYITGGDAEILLPYLSEEIVHIPGLVLEGLRIYAQVKNS